MQHPHSLCGYKRQGHHVFEYLAVDPRNPRRFMVFDGARRVLRRNLTAREALVWLEDAEPTMMGRHLRHLLDSIPPKDWPSRIEAARRGVDQRCRPVQRDERAQREAREQRADRVQTLEMLHWLRTEAFSPLARRALGREGYSPEKALDDLANADPARRETARRAIAAARRQLEAPLLPSPPSASDSGQPSQPVAEPASAHQRAALA